jgi:chlorophyll(ide) b reductase
MTHQPTDWPAGVGRALAQEFLGAGDNVCISSRSADRVQETVADLGAAAAAGGGSLRGTAADVSKPADVAKLAQFVTSSFGSVDIWINNAGSNGYK